MLENSQFQCPSHIVDPLHARQPDVVLPGLTDTCISQALLDLLLKDITFGDLDMVGQGTISSSRRRRRYGLTTASPVHRNLMIVISYTAAFARTNPDLGRFWSRVCAEKCRRFIIPLDLVPVKFVEARRRNRQGIGLGKTYSRAWRFYILVN